MNNVTFVGLGEIGNALATVIQPNAQVRAWDKDPTKLPAGSPSTLQEAVTGAEVVFLCVPSWIIRDVATQIKPWLSASCVVISLAKGLEQGTLQTMNEVLEDSLSPGQPCGVLGGPLLAEELRQGLPSFAALGAPNPAAATVIRALFKETCVSLETVEDARSVALASVLKNVYAVGLGVADGLNWGYNAKGWLSARALTEMQGIIESLGADGRTTLTSAGAGDFLATSMSPDSRNRETGREIARTGACTTPSEGCRAIQAVKERLRQPLDAYPFLQTLDRIVNEQHAPAEAFHELISKKEKTL